MRTVLVIDVVGSHYSPCFPSGVHMRNFAYIWSLIEVPEPYQHGDATIRGYAIWPPLGWGVNEQDLYYRDLHHDGLL